MVRRGALGERKRERCGRRDGGRERESPYVSAVLKSFLNEPSMGQREPKRRSEPACSSRDFFPALRCRAFRDAARTAAAAADCECDLANCNIVLVFSKWQPDDCGGIVGVQPRSIGCTRRFPSRARIPPQLETRARCSSYLEQAPALIH